MLVTLCQHCWSWMEPRHERCVECGETLDLLQPDPVPSELKALLGSVLATLGEVSLKRPRLPSSGVLTAFENGLFFLPDLRQLPSGGIVAVEFEPRPTAGNARPGIWNLFSRRSTPTISSEPKIFSRSLMTAETAATRFLESPGALFIARKTIVRIVQRESMLRIERKPGKTLTWKIESPSTITWNMMRKLQRDTAWRSVSVAGTP